MEFLYFVFLYFEFLYFVFLYFVFFVFTRMPMKVTVGDSGLCCCVCVTSFQSLSTLLCVDCNPEIEQTVTLTLKLTR